MPLGSDTAAPLVLPDEWRVGLDALRNLSAGQAVLLVGAPDRGKTTFATLAARALASGTQRVAVVDADIGQSEIGPPATVGVAWARNDAERLSDLKPANRYFVGSFNPARVGLELVSATGRATSWARQSRADLILIDTTGFVTGPSARRIKLHKARLVQPSLIIGFGDEVQAALLPALAAATSAQTLSLPTPGSVRRKPAGLRTTRRLTRLSAALTPLSPLRLPLRQIATLGATLGTGTPLSPELLRWCGATLRLPITHAEVTDDTLTFWLSGPPRRDWESGLAPVRAHFRVDSVRALSWAAHEGALVGLGDNAGRLVSLARFAGWEPERGELLFDAPPLATPDAVRLVEWGRVRLAPDGQPQGELRPGDL